MKYHLYMFSLLVLMPSSSAWAQEDSTMSWAVEEPMDKDPSEYEFIFIRGRYHNYLSSKAGGRFGFRGRGPGPNRDWWQTDFDDADRNLLRGVKRYTSVDTSSRAYKAMSLTDPELFEHPFLYINMKRVPLFSGNGPNFSPEEAYTLREYMLRGGFVMLDDFWGPEHWNDFLIELDKIFPDRELEKLDTSHLIFQCFFEIPEITQVPGRGATWNYGWGFSLDDPNYPTAVHGVFDDEDRLMLLVNFNTDLGDGWEHTFDQFYPTSYCNEAYKLGINYIIYALTH